MDWFWSVELTCCCNTDDAIWGGRLMMEEMMGPLSIWCSWFSCRADAGMWIVSTRGSELATPAWAGNVICTGISLLGSNPATTDVVVCCGWGAAAVVVVGATGAFWGPPALLPFWLLKVWLRVVAGGLPFSSLIWVNCCCCCCCCWDGLDALDFVPFDWTFLWFDCKIGSFYENFLIFRLFGF